MAADELETLTHHQTNLPIKKELYVRYKKIAKVGNPAKYDYIYVKLNCQINRKKLAESAFGKKIDEYWFSSADGGDSGTDAIIMDAKEPTEGNPLVTFNRGVRPTLANNMESISGERKYYFLPEELTVKGEDGVTYTITPWDGSSTTWNKVYCKYITTPSQDSHTYDSNKINEILNTCAIRYGKDHQRPINYTTADGGAFENNKLYVKIGSERTHIATLNQETGEIELLSKPQTKAVLNAIGYKPNHANVPTEMRAWVGIIARNECQLAKPVSDFKFLASWQRPINLLPIKKEEREDATTNGATVKIIDLLKLYDWRGCKDAKAATDDGKMWDENTWFWAYYGVNNIRVDVRKNSVKTNLNMTANRDNVSKWPTLGEVTDKIDLYWSNGSSQEKDDYHDFNLNLSSYNYIAQNSALITYLSDVANTGQIIYHNNGENVTEFSLCIPVTVSYTWGDIKDNLILTIKRTIGN